MSGEVPPRAEGQRKATVWAECLIELVTLLAGMAKF